MNEAQRQMKPRVSYSAVFGLTAWDEAYERMKTLPEKTKLYARGQEFKLDCILGDPHPPSVWFTYRRGGKHNNYVCRRGDSLLTELSLNGKAAGARVNQSPADAPVRVGAGSAEDGNVHRS